MSVTIHIDGLCMPKNPGGYACWAYEATDGQRCIGRDYGCAANGTAATNNLAEHAALLEALKRARREGWSGLTIYSDSQLVVNQVNGKWQCNSPALFELMSQSAKLLAQLGGTLVWIPREENERADYLSNVAYNKARQGVLQPVAVQSQGGASW